MFAPSVLRFGIGESYRSLALFANDVHKIAHCKIDIHEVQTPVCQDLTIRSEIAADVVGSWAGWFAVHRYLEIGGVLIGCAAGCEQSGNADPRSVDRPFGNDPG